MKRLRLTTRWSGHLLQAHPRPGTALLIATASSHPAQSNSSHRPAVRCYSAAAAEATQPADDLHVPEPLPSPSQRLSSAKLAALHARLSLSRRIPLQTLARALISASADATTNNANLALLGSSIVNYHVLEYLVCKWPRLPLAVLYEALRAFSGPESLQQVAKRWGVEEAAAPGPEVDSGLLQWSMQDGSVITSRWGHVRAETERNQSNFRRGMSSRVVLDDAFGDEAGRSAKQLPKEHRRPFFQAEAYSSFVQAVVGAIHAHCGRESAKSFVTSHILSRQLDLAPLFSFQLPTRELAMLCAREGLEPPVARLESETGRLSRTPVFVVGIYSGNDKLGEGSGPSLDVARKKASMNALKAWYMYSPGNKVRVPSDTMTEGAKPWTPPHIDIGEII